MPDKNHRSLNLKRLNRLLARRILKLGLYDFPAPQPEEGRKAAVKQSIGKRMSRITKLISELGSEAKAGAPDRKALSGTISFQIPPDLFEKYRLFAQLQSARTRINKRPADKQAELATLAPEGITTVKELRLRQRTLLKYFVGQLVQFKRFPN